MVLSTSRWRIADDVAVFGNGSFVKHSVSLDCFSSIIQDCLGGLNVHQWPLSWPPAPAIGWGTRVVHCSTGTAVAT